MTALELARAERESFAAFLETLSPEQWQARPFVSVGMSARLPHMPSVFDELTRGELVARFLKGGLLIDRINQVGVDDYADRSPERLIALIREYARPHGLTAGFGGKIALTDNMIHQQDIRRTLGTPRTIPAERLRTALDFSLYAPTIRGAWRARGVRLVATDIDWSHGKGPEVQGPGEALLVAMAGRRDGLKDLSGPGKDTLAHRL